MKFEEIVRRLLTAANELDKDGHFVLADNLTSAAIRLADFFPEENPDEFAGDVGMLEGDAYEDNMRTMREVNNDDLHEQIMSRIQVLQGIPDPTGEHVEELSKLMDYVHSPSFDRSNVTWPAGEDADKLRNILEPQTPMMAPHPDDPFQNE